MHDIVNDRHPTDMDEFLVTVQDARTSLEAVVDGRSEYELTQLRDHAGWAVKDHLYHIAAWERGLINLLRHRPRYHGMSLDERSYNELDIDGMNAVIFARTKNLPLAKVLEEFRATHRELVDLLSTFSLEDVQRPYAYYAPSETGEDRADPAFNWVFGDTVEHFEEHQEWIEAILNQSPEADGLR